MYMRIIWGRTTADGWNSIEENYRLLIDRPVAGLKGRWLLRDANDPESFFGLTLWVDRDSIERWEGSDEFKNEFLPAIRPFMIGSRSVAVCEVVFEKTIGDVLASSQG